MSRAIKFRVWNPLFKQMFYPVKTWYHYPSVGKNKYLRETLGSVIDAHNEGTVSAMQFTGLKDKNGADIYEGDIWKRDGFISTVEFQFSRWAFVKTDSSECYQYPEFYSNADTGKIIGNIHENPELLTK